MAHLDGAGFEILTGTGSAPRTRSRAVALSTSTVSIERDVCGRAPAMAAVASGCAMASRLPRSSSGATVICCACRIGCGTAGDWQDMEQSTPIVWMPCQFGGARPYFVCPGIVNGIACGRRVTKLYGAATYFLCRHCCRLVYAAQREDRYDRASTSCQQDSHAARRRAG